VSSFRWGKTRIGVRVLLHGAFVVGAVEQRDVGSFGVCYYGLDGKGHMGTLPFATEKQAKRWVENALRRDLKHVQP
jgi:hypothetical protein